MAGLPWLTALCILSSYSLGVRAAVDQYVKPFTGTENGGNMFPGVALPFGMVKLGVDVALDSQDAYSGYLPSGKVTGFSMMHESGTGGSPKYGVVSQLPVIGTITNPLEDYSVSRASSDNATLGTYTVSLSNGVVVSLAAAEHSGMIQHTFPTTSEDMNVLVDVSHFLPDFRGLGYEQRYAGGGLSISQDGSYTGYGTYNGGWNYAENWQIFFCGRFNEQPVSSKTFASEGLSDTTLTEYGENSDVSGAKRVGAVFTFSGNSSYTRKTRRSWQLSRLGRLGARQINGRADFVLQSSIGISFISEENACNYIESEIPTTSDPVRSLQEATASAWDDQVFSAVTTKETDTSKLELLYTSIYGMFLIPSDRTGENPTFNSSEPYFDDIVTLWDLFRSGTPLFHILQPDRYAKYIRSLIDVYRHQGYMPDARSSNFNGRTQGGSNCDNVLADAYVKGVTDGIDWDDGYAAMQKDAEVTPPNNNDPLAPDSSTKEGRGALPDWKEYGYITQRYTRSVTRAIEYSLNDFALYQVASGLGKSADADKYKDRSQNWQNHWDKRMTYMNFTGFLSPITTNGSFPTTPQNPISCGGCYWGDDYYESLPIEYSFNAHHDMKTLIDFSGGDQKFVARLELLFQEGLYSGNAEFGNTLFNPGNEPSFATPYLFNFVPGKQHRSVAISRRTAAFYTTSASGLPGNSDSGAMQSWILWSIIGLYPITGTTTFLIGSPQLSDLSIDLGNGKTFTVTSTGGDESSGAWYVQSLKVNGKTWNKSWVDWEDVFEDGGTMDFVLGADPVEWDTGDRPLWDIL